jgi:polysaccharide export outer membrane protein
MLAKPWQFTPALPGLLLVCLLTVAGCHSPPHFDEAQLAQSDLPRELNPLCLPDYVIEPPDVLVIDALRVVPRPPYRAAPLDSLLISVPNAFSTEPIGGIYPISPEGTVNLGASYGSVRVVGKSLSEIRSAIERHLRAIIKEPRVVVYLGQARGVQQIRGEHLVCPDGSVRLGVYGSVRVAGMTLQQAREALEAHLSQFLQNPEISVDVAGYNSKVYYVVFDGGGNGQQLLRLPITGNETVLDALTQARGLPPVSSTHRIWVARPARPDEPCDQVLPVDWVGITTRGRTATNYQLLPGDRIYVDAQPLVRADTYLARVFSPIERIFGITLLGSGVVHSFGRQNGNTGGFGR